MNVEEHIKINMRALGCNSDTKITLAYHLYMHLIDHKLMYDTEVCYNKDVDTLYVVAKPSKNAKLNIYVPVPTSFDVNMEFISTLQTNLCTVETGPTINLAFIEGDFTIVMYTFTQGFVDRLPADEVTHLRKRESRRMFIKGELKKNKEQIVNDALNGGVVED